MPQLHSSFDDYVIRDLSPDGSESLPVDKDRDVSTEPSLIGPLYGGVYRLLPKNKLKILKACLRCITTTCTPMRDARIDVDCL